MDEREEEVHEDQEEEEEAEVDWDDRSTDDRRMWMIEQEQQFLLLQWVWGLNAHGQRNDPETESQSSSDNSVMPRIVGINAPSLDDAVSALQRTAGREISELNVSMQVPRSEWSDEEATNHPQIFGRFVDLLADPTRVVRAIKFDGIHFHTKDGIRAADLEKLFGTTLPSHPTLERIHLHGGAFSNECLSRFTSSVHSNHETPLVELAFDGSFVDRDRARIFADLVRRNSQLRALTLSALFNGLSPEDFRLISEGLSSNTNLQSLSVQLAQVLPDTLERAVASTSPLFSLHVKAYLGKEPVKSLALQLRTNVTLVELTVSQQYSVSNASHYDPIADTLQTFNFTLLRFVHGTLHSWSWDVSRHTVPGGDGGRIGKCLRRNERIRRALQQLSNYHVPSTRLWPSVLEMVSPLPTLLYRFLRKGNVQALCEIAVRRISNERKRGRANGQ